MFANFVLADEINRAPAKVQSALLEVMAEHQVSIGGQTFPVPEPFLVLATQNPIESEGVYPLPEAQRDRFLMKVVVGYPTAGEEVEIVHRMGVRPAGGRAEVLGARASSIQLQAAADEVYVDRGVVDYAVTLVLATRDPENYALSRARAAHHLRRQPPGQPRPGRRRPGAGPAAGPQLRAAPGRLRRRPRRAAPPPRAVLRGAGPGRHADQILARVLSTVPAPARRARPASDPRRRSPPRPTPTAAPAPPPAAPRPAPPAEHPAPRRPPPSADDRPDRPARARAPPLVACRAADQLPTSDVRGNPERGPAPPRPR